MRGKSFLFDPTEDEQTVFSAMGSTIEIWHKRFSHYHHYVLLLMQRKQMTKDLPVLDEAPSNCQACPKATWRASHKLQLIHTDLPGLQKTLFLKGSLYHIIFIDDLTRMCWIYFLKRKSEVTRVCWNFKKRIEN